MEALHPALQALSDLLKASTSTVESTAFQTMLVATIEALNRVLHAEEAAASAAISLAQQERMQELIHQIQYALGLLMGVLREPGKRLLSLAPEHRIEPPNSWWYALSEAVSQVERDMQWLHSLIQGQAPDSPTYRLGQLVEELLEEHLTRLSEEAERWNP